MIKNNQDIPENEKEIIIYDRLAEILLEFKKLFQIFSKENASNDKKILHLKNFFEKRCRKDSTAPGYLPSSCSAQSSGGAGAIIP